MPPKVSVIVPSYNHARFLRQRIDTVLAQSMQDFELILLDDCSTDDSQRIVEDYRHHPKTAAVRSDSGRLACSTRAATVSGSRRATIWRCQPCWPR